MDRSTELRDLGTDHQTKALRPRMTSEEIRRMSHETLGSGTEVWLREIALQLAALNDRADADAKVFNEMVEKGNGLRV
jgi:hypothetical protein